MGESLFYETEIGKFKTQDEINTIDEIRKYILSNYTDKLKGRSSLHEYIDNTPLELQTLVDKVRKSQRIKNLICSKYKQCDVTQLSNTDELYISHYNLDGGGDQGLYDKHYDGVLRFINDATIVRALVYVNSNDDFKVHFLDSKKSHHFSNYEFGILDFNREYHWVEGSYNKNMDYKDSRILLKINYLICPNCSSLYTKFIIFLNESVFFIVKKCMEYSKSPQTPAQHIIGFFCNLFRWVNNISVYLTFILAITIIVIVFAMLRMVINYIPYGSKLKKR
jgi:hypothetical protein